jgi:hypothetical protein
MSPDLLRELYTSCSHHSHPRRPPVSHGSLREPRSWSHRSPHAPWPSISLEQPPERCSWSHRYCWHPHRSTSSLPRHALSQTPLATTSTRLRAAHASSCTSEELLLEAPSRRLPAPSCRSRRSSSQTEFGVLLAEVCRHSVISTGLRAGSKISGTRVEMCRARL